MEGLYLISDRVSISHYDIRADRKLPLRNYKNRLVKWIMLSRDLYIIMRAHKFDSLHFTSEDVPIIFISLMRKIGFLPRDLKIICTVHDLGEFVIHRNRYSYPKVLLRRITIPLIAFSSDCIIVPSKNTYKDIKSYFGESIAKKTVVIYNAIIFPHKNFIGDTGEFLNLGLGKYLLYVAELHHPSKNHIRLIRAFKKIAELEKYRDLKLILVGPKGKGADTILSLINAEDLGENIKYLGYVNNDLLYDLYKNAHMLLMVSLYEGFGRPVVEAMYFNLPIVASNVGSLLEIARDAAEYVDPFIEESIFRGIKNVLEEPILRDRLIKNAKSLLGEYSIDKIKAPLLELYNK
jgi:glycosyltransferase involved in cell wall biosynthesis